MDSPEFLVFFFLKEYNVIFTTETTKGPKAPSDASSASTGDNWANFAVLETARSSGDESTDPWPSATKPLDLEPSLFAAATSAASLIKNSILPPPSKVTSVSQSSNKAWTDSTKKNSKSTLPNNSSWADFNTNFSEATKPNPPPSSQAERKSSVSGSNGRTGGAVEGKVSTDSWGNSASVAADWANGASVAADWANGNATDWPTPATNGNNTINWPANGTASTDNGNLDWNSSKTNNNNNNSSGRGGWANFDSFASTAGNGRDDSVSA